MIRRTDMNTKLNLITRCTIQTRSSGEIIFIRSSALKQGNVPQEPGGSVSNNRNEYQSSREAEIVFIILTLNSTISTPLEDIR